MPLFSVVVVCFNAEETIKQTIDSVLSQTFEDYEIIVKDDFQKIILLKIYLNQIK